MKKLRRYWPRAIQELWVNIKYVLHRYWQYKLAHPEQHLSEPEGM